MEPNIMLSLLSEVHFWTLRDDICIPNSDLGAFRYHEKKSHDDSVFCEGKKIYVERRAQTWVPPNKRPVRLKDNLKELEEHLSQQRLVLCQWRDSSLLQLMFSSGLFVNISINVFTGDLLSITFDKYLVGKLLSDYVADVVLTKSHIICSYNDSHLTMVYLSKPTLKRTHPKSFSRLDPRVHTIDLAGPSGRRLERKLVGNVSGDMFVVWWHSSHDEVYPWSPVVKDQDRANVLVYGISGIKADLLCHHRSEFDLLSISFSQVHSNVVRAVEQKVSRNGDVTVESSSYQISKGSMQKNSAASIILPTHVCCHGYSPLQDKLLLGCIDGSLVLYDDALGVTHTVRATFIPSTVSWHPDGGIFIIGNERCQFQILDVALATLKQQLLSEDITPSNLLDITPYFRFQPNLRFMKWSKKSENSFYGEKFVSSDSLLLLLFDRGPFAVLRFVGGGGLIGDIHGSGGFSVDSIVAQYLWANQVDKAINLLLSMNWDIAGNKSLSCLQRIVNYLFKLPLTPDREVQIQTVLGCFHMPVRPMCPATIDEFKAPLRDLTRRFFHQLLRHRLYEKAFRLAIDLMDRDLFMDIHYSAKKFGEIEIAEAAFKKAEDIDSGSYVSSVSGSSNSKCSRSSCSDCSESTSMVSDSENEPTVERNEYYSQQNSSTKKEITSRIILPYGLSPPSESRPSSTFTHPPLPILPQIVPGISGSSSTTNQEMNIDKSIFHGTRSLRENVSSSTHNRGIQACNQRVENDSLLITCEKDLPVLSMLNAPTVQHERPKVKFCGSVKQVTLCHDRLHTLPEEEEDTQLAIPLSSTGVASTKQTFHASGNENQSLMAAQSLLSSFTLSANSVGIPIVPHTLPGVGFPDRRNIDSNGRPLSSHFLPKPQSISANSYSAGSSYLPWMVDHGQMIGPPSQAAITPTLPPPCTNTLKSFQHNSVMCDVGELNHEKHNQKWKAIDLDDPLGSKELSALLPGSRKPLASSINFYEKNLNSHTLGNQSQGAESPESNYLNMYNGGKNGEEERHFLASSSLAPHENVSSLLDLSEEEENNGSIKIVHFGVV